MTEQMIEVPLMLTEQQRRDVLRFHETTEDDQGYDVPADRMKSLARVGLIRSIGFKRYEFTDSGLAVVGAISESASGVFHTAVTGDAAGIEPFAWIADYAACGGGLSVFTADQVADNTDNMCTKTPVYTLKSFASALAAIKTLEAGGYVFKGGDMWELPVGAAPGLSQHQGAPVDLSLQSMLNLNWSAEDVVRAITDQGPLYRKPPVSHGDKASLRKVYDLIGLSYSQPVSVLLVNFKNIIRFANLLHAIEREFLMVPGEPSDKPDDEGSEPDDVCLVNCWGSSEAEYIEQFRAALNTLTENRSTEFAKYIAVLKEKCDPDLFDEACKCVRNLVPALIAENETLKAKTVTWCGYGDEHQMHYYHGDVEAIRALGNLISELEELRQDANRPWWSRMFSSRTMTIPGPAAELTNTSGQAHCPHCAVCHTAEETCIQALRRVLSLYERTDHGSEGV
ncbi:hypothetical protein K5D56_21555 [Pseudomonas cichorii]|nr:hypothetical protein [Pseudomonas cichorii]MBX8557054.1 hypothetical protein [Pseudomonas cichorii]MBX8591955.1 hypothetical protein [Pseudomonas cichorii]